MAKKTWVIAGLLMLVVLAAGGFYAYKNKMLNRFLPGLRPEKLLASFENKNPDLPAETFDSFRQRFEESKAELEKDPDLFNVWLQVGVLKKAVGDYEGARDVFIYAGRIRPQNSSSFASLADIYAYFLDEPEKAEKAIKTAIENDPTDASYRLALADIYRYKLPGKENMYEQTLLDALKEIPNEVNLVSALATYYRQNDQVDQAIVYYEQLVKLNPDNQMAKEDLAELKAKK